ncbi:hypothetical protein E4656_08410 [Natronospirillum operosum]|uniref:Uncharacterized protein n=1 Tax=Natronospirillum operosum TaxID=2759953 RepID=A0A4Z0WFF2_9GAMM|nr:hypothetical protein [Natronospirillum operosum]TGG94182.1 hypothetical protein E4656_08410 [Natronospirillum operosum]
MRKVDRKNRQVRVQWALETVGLSTVSTFVFKQFEQDSPGLGMAMSVVAIFTTTALILGLTAFSRKKLMIG